MIASGLHVPITHSRQVLKKIRRILSNSTGKVLLYCYGNSIEIIETVRSRIFYILFKQPIELSCMFPSLSCALSLITMLINRQSRSAWSDEIEGYRVFFLLLLKTKFASYCITHCIRGNMAWMVLQFSLQVFTWMPKSVATLERLTCDFHKIPYEAIPYNFSQVLLLSKYWAKLS